MKDFEGPRCQTCPHWFRDDGMAETKGLCRRFPPQVVCWLNPHATTPEEEVLMRSQFPIMMAAGVCGEHPQIKALAPLPLEQQRAARAR